MLEKLAKKHGMTVEGLKILVKKGVIRETPTNKDMVFLSRMGRLWKDPEWLKVSLRQAIRSRVRREKFVLELDLTKPEKYALNRYMNARGRLSVERVTREVSYYYRVPLNTAGEIVERMRTRAYKAKSRKRREGKITVKRRHKS